MIDAPLESAVKSVPGGAWAVGVSGGADSTALLSLLRSRPDLSLHIVHLDHQTRGQQSTDDASFVAELSMKMGLPCTIARREQIEPQLTDAPANLSARFRALRLVLFEQVVRSANLAGVILAHHADDQAETVLQRLLRGSGYAGLAGMSPRVALGALVALRPLLEVRREMLRQYLKDQQLRWREDESNQSSKYQRNRLRPALARSPALVEGLLALSKSCGELRDWARGAAPVLESSFRAAELSRLPAVLGHESARCWLIERGVPVDQIEPGTIDRLLTMSADAASPGRVDFPGPVRIGRRKGMISMVT